MLFRPFLIKMPKKKEVEIKTKKKKVVASPTVKKGNNPFTLEVKVNDVEFKTQEKDLETALKGFVNSPLFPRGAKTTTLITFSNGEKIGKRIWKTVIARRMLSIMKIKPEAIKILAEKLTSEIS